MEKSFFRNGRPIIIIIFLVVTPETVKKMNSTKLLYFQIFHFIACVLNANFGTETGFDDRGELKISRIEIRLLIKIPKPWQMGKMEDGNRFLKIQLLSLLSQN